VERRSRSPDRGALVGLLARELVAAVEQMLRNLDLISGQSDLGIPADTLVLPLQNVRDCKHRRG
jgi:hypothetical protein